MFAFGTRILESLPFRGGGGGVLPRAIVAILSIIVSY